MNQTVTKVITPYISLYGLSSSTGIDPPPPEIVMAMRKHRIRRVKNSQEILHAWTGPVMLDDEGAEFQRIHCGEATQDDWQHFRKRVGNIPGLPPNLGIYGLPPHANPYAEGWCDAFMHQFTQWSMPDCALGEDVEADMYFAGVLCKRQVAKHGASKVMPVLKLWTIGATNALNALSQDTLNCLVDGLYAVGVRHLHFWEIHEEDYIRLSMDPPESHPEAKWANDYFGDTYRLDPSRILPDAIKFTVQRCEMIRIACDKAMGRGKR